MRRFQIERLAKVSRSDKNTTVCLIISVFALFIAVFCWSITCEASGTTLGWDESPESNVAGYYIYYGATSDDYTESVQIVGKSTTSYPIANLNFTSGQTYYIAITPYTDTGVEGAYSNEIVYEEIKPETVANLQSTTHTVGEWSSNPRITVQWTAAVDTGGSGLDGYSIVWDTNSDTLPDTKKDIEDVTTITSSTLSGETYYFHIRSVDKALNWSETAEHLGPFCIYTETFSGTAPTDTIVNPGFEDDAGSWRFYTDGEGDFVVTGPAYEGCTAACVTTDTGGTNIQLYQYNLSLEPNTNYQLSFSAYSNTGHDLRVSIFKHVAPYTNYGLPRPEVNLTTSWNTYTIDFTTPDFGAPVDDARLMFWFADDATAGDQFWIDNVVLSSADVPPPPPPPATDTIVNPGFEDGAGSWRFYTDGEGDFVVTGPAYEGCTAACVTTDTGGTNIQLYQYNLSLEPNTNYQLSFSAYSNTGHDLRVSIFKHVAPYTNYGLLRPEVNLTTRWNTYTIDFTTPDFGAPVDDARLMFWFADDATAGDQFWIDNVVLFSP